MNNESEQSKYIPDLPDPNSPFFILRRSDDVLGSKSALVKIKTQQMKAGPPIIIPWEPASYGKPTDLPDDTIEMTEALLVFDQLDTAESGGALISKALYEKLDSLVPGACKTVDAVFVGPDGSKLDYRAVFPEKRLESKEIEDAQQNDLQWGNMAFNEKDAPGELFVLTSGDMSYIVISRRVAEKLPLDTFRKVMLSGFHRTSAEGGARPAIAALERVLNNQEKPEDIELLQKSFRDARENDLTK